ncbi:MAG: hypothetical protein ACI8R9_001098 [Paraglaciecola sp.]|jgi:hypothetical protein
MIKSEATATRRFFLSGECLQSESCDGNKNLAWMMER